MEKRAIPKGLVVFQYGNAVVIRRRWEKGAGASALCATAMSLWPFMLMHPGRPHGSGIWPVVLEYLPHAGLLFGAAYFGLCSLVNRTDVILSGDGFRAESTPLPWWGDRKVSAQEIREVAVGKRKAREGGAKLCLVYIDRYGKEHELVRAGKGREQIDFIGKAVADILAVKFDAAQTEGSLEPWMRRVNAWATSSSRVAPKRDPATGSDGASEGIP